MKRALLQREAKVHENDKQAMFIKGGRTSEVVTQALRDLVCDAKWASVFVNSGYILFVYLFSISFLNTVVHTM